MKRKPVTILIRGKLWRLAFCRMRRLWGECDYDQRLIRINPSADELTLLDTTIHECLHAALPDLNEEAVLQVATDLATALHKLGYRQAA